MVLAADRAAIVGLVLESTLWGFSVLMFFTTIYLLCRRRSFRDINYVNVAISFALLFLSTLHVVVMANRAITGFVTSPVGPITYFSRLERSTVYMAAAYFFQTMLGDAVVIFRCYVVWQTIWVVVVPIALWCGMAGVAIYFIHKLTLIPNGTQALFADNLWPSLFFSLSLAANVLSTGLLAYRIYRISRDVSGSQQNTMERRVLPILYIAIDAAILYTILLITAIVDVNSHSNDTILVVNVIVPSISIIFYMVIMRIALTQAAHHRSNPTAAAPHSNFTTTQMTEANRNSVPNNNNNRPQLTTVDMRATGSHFTEDSKEIRELRLRMGLDSEASA